MLVLLVHDDEPGPDGSIMNHFLDNEPNWNLEIMSDNKFMITLIYFTFTSLSTVGFGDYYPITNNERILGAFVLLGGVAIFSYTMGEL